MARRRFGGYQGRSTVRDVLKAGLCVLIVLLVLAVAGLIIGQRYIVYTDDGVRLELPFFQREQTPAPDESLPVDVVQLPEKPKPWTQAGEIADIAGEKADHKTIQEQ